MPQKGPTVHPPSARIRIYQMRPKDLRRAQAHDRFAFATT